MGARAKGVRARGASEAGALARGASETGALARGAPGAVAARRLKRASAFVFAVVLSTALACAAAGAGHAGPAGAGPAAGRLWEAIRAGEDFEEALNKEGIVKLTSENVPGWLEEELLGLDEMDQAIANDAFELLWFSRKGVADEVAASISAALAPKGWLSRGKGPDDTETFVKKEGVCSWAMVECAQAGEDVVVVLRIKHT